MDSKTLTIIFVDIQGFTSRTSRQTREENQRFIKELSQFIKRHAENYSGIVVKAMGDGFLITFESPTNAVSCGLDIQKEIGKRNANILDSDNFVKFRIGISTGEVDVDETGDVYGEAVNIAARIEKFAEPNGVFISESTYLAMNKTEIQALDLGPQQFKNILREIRVYKVLDEEKLKGLPSVKHKYNSKKNVLIAGGVMLVFLMIFFGYQMGKSGKFPKKYLAQLPEETTPEPDTPDMSVDAFRKDFKNIMMDLNRLEKIADVKGARLKL